MIRIIENINNDQTKLFKCYEKMQQIYNICKNGKNNIYQLLERYALAKRNLALSYNVAYRLSDSLTMYNKRIDTVNALVDMASKEDSNTPSSFITDNEIISINTNPEIIYALLSSMDEKIIDYEEFIKIYDCERINTSSANISLLNEKITNNALFRAFKSHNVNECALLPSDARAEIIKMLQAGLNIYDTGDIYVLFEIAEQKLKNIYEETKMIDNQTLTRKK